MAEATLDVLIKGTKKPSGLLVSEGFENGC